MTIILELSQAEADMLVQFIDLAVKSVGVRAGADGNHLYRKLLAAGEEAKRLTGAVPDMRPMADPPVSVLELMP